MQLTNTTPTTLGDTRRRRPVAAVMLAFLTVTAWLQDAASGEAHDDAGQSSENALMIILGITVAGIVAAAAIAYINAKTALFK